MNRRRHWLAQQRGVTLVELLVVMVIVAILAAVGYPSYTDYVVRSQRSATQSMMMQMADRQEQFFIENKRYANNLTALGYAADSVGLHRKGQLTTSADPDRSYLLNIVVLPGDMVNGNPMGYRVRAIPQLVQATRDTGCGTLFLTHTGQRVQQGTATNCW